MRTRLITVRNRLDVLLFVFVASYFLCCGDVEVNPGPVDSDSPSQQQHDTEEHSVMTNAVNVPDVTTAGPTHSAAGNEDCKSTGHTPGDGQLRGGDSPGCLTENSGQSDVKGAREGLHHDKGSGGLTVSGTGSCGLTVSGTGSGGLMVSGTGSSGLTVSGKGSSGLTVSGKGSGGLTVSGKGSSGLTVSGKGVAG
ncbi:hypothetical protein ACOMHN_017227 [Nucella lapillus]